MGAKREIQLDVVRGLAIVLAVGWHFNTFAGNPVFDALMFPGRKLGWAGVDLFFVLSGFLVGRLILREAIDTGGFDYRRFLVRRMFRLWPVLYFFVISQMVLTDRKWSTFVPQVMFHVQNYFATPLAALWSLAVEEHFYLLAGLLLPLWAARHASPGTLFRALAALIVGATVLRWIGLYLGQSYLALQTYTHYRVDALSCGVLLAGISIFRPELYERIKANRRLLLAIVLLGCALLIPTETDKFYRTAVGYNIATIASAALLLFMDKVTIPSPLQIPSRVLAFLGIYSYSLYIWHYSTGTAGMRAVTKYLHVTDPMLLVATRYGVAISAAIIVTKIIEQPMLALRDKLFPSDAHRQRQAPVTPVTAPGENLRQHS